MPLVTAGNPLVRFIGSDDMVHNHRLFGVWLQTLAKWRQSTTPYLFLHTPDIAQAPELVSTLWEDLRRGDAKRVGAHRQFRSKPRFSDILLC
ncbi:Uncharacterised protein [Raoultella planticola]|uniref:DUF72 domain-containing protein n=1 Tax=Raoultella planticola TaxID=575 RepID=A0A485ACZ6_RAOPL|nr:Uncharacterised protein [Raoultella planticola]